MDDCMSLNLTVYWVTIYSTSWLLLDLVYLHLIDTICPAMRKNTYCSEMGLKQYLDDTIVQHHLSQPHGSVSIYRLHHQRTGGELIEILMNTTETQWWLGVNSR